MVKKPTMVAPVPLAKQFAMETKPIPLNNPPKSRKRAQQNLTPDFTQGHKTPDLWRSDKLGTALPQPSPRTRKV